MSLVFAPESASHLWSFFFFNDTAPTEIYTLSLHDALPISAPRVDRHGPGRVAIDERMLGIDLLDILADRKSTRLNSSHMSISYAVFCLKKKIDRLLRGGELHNEDIPERPDRATVKRRRYRG